MSYGYGNSEFSLLSIYVNVPDAGSKNGKPCVEGVLVAARDSALGKPRNMNATKLTAA